MSLKSENQLKPGHRDSVKRAKLAQQSNNLDYAIDLLQAVLKEEPLFLDGRRLLRVIEIQKFRARSTFDKKMVGMKSSAAAMQLNPAKKEPGEQMAMAEDVLEDDPFNLRANTIISDAGVALGFPIFKAFAYETVAEGQPNNKQVLNSLAEAYMELKEFPKAEKTYQRILDFDKKDGDALSGLKNATAANASHSGGWESAKDQGDFRGALKDKEESDQLEQDSKQVKSLEAIEQQIQVNYQRWQAQPTNPVHSKTIASLYVQKNDYATAALWYEEAFTSGNKTDSSLEKVIGDLKLQAAEQTLNQLKKDLTLLTDPDQVAQQQAAIEHQEKELGEARLFLAEARVRAQPNEGEFRFDLGDALYKVGQYKRAVEELQQSLKQPSVRYPALNLMGQAFMKRNMLDFAIKQLLLAQSELVGMDEMKKQLTYNLGLAYELSKQPDKALDQWKMIYEYDMTYRDVAQRVEDSYNNGESA